MATQPVRHTAQRTARDEGSALPGTKMENWNK